MKERLQKLLSDKNLSSTEFARMINVQPSTISHILSGRNKPGFDFIQSLLTRFTDVNATWLITGHGPMYSRDIPMESATSGTAKESGLFADKVNIPAPAASPAATERLTEKAGGKKVSKVVLYYDDKTYEEFLPS